MSSYRSFFWTGEIDNQAEMYLIQPKAWFLSTGHVVVPKRENIHLLVERNTMLAYDEDGFFEFLEEDDITQSINDEGVLV